VRARSLILPISVAGATLALSALLVVVAGGSPLLAFAALLDGSISSIPSLGETLARSTGLILCALAAVVAFRAGVLNIGVEGQLLMGAAAAAAIGPLFESPSVSRLALLSGAALAGALSVLPAFWLAEKRGVPPVLSTILLNLVAAAAVTWLVRGPLRDPAGDYPQSRPLSDEIRLNPLISGFRPSAAVVLALLLAVVVWLVLRETTWGLKLRAAGLSPKATRSAGLNDVRIRGLSFAASGALAGLAGGLEVAAITGRLYDPFAAGIGFTGIAAALLGGTHPLGATAAAVLFAALGVGSNAMQRDAGVPAALATVIPAILVLALLMAKGKRKE